MFELDRKKSNRLFAFLMAAILLVILFFATSLIIENLEHDCKGENCPVCECLQVCESVLQQVGAGFVPVFCTVLAIISALVALSYIFAEFIPHNLITLKIRLNI